MKIGIHTVSFKVDFCVHFMINLSIRMILENIFAANEKLKSPIIQSLMQFINPVDVFIFIGGFLASYTTTTTTMKLIHNGERKRFIVISYIGLRYLRFTPQLIFYILLSFVLPLNGIWLNGPTWTKRMQQIQMKCTKTWWHSLIYMQNLIDPKNMVRNSDDQYIVDDDDFAFF